MMRLIASLSLALAAVVHLPPPRYCPADCQAVKAKCKPTDVACQYHLQWHVIPPPPPPPPSPASRSVMMGTNPEQRKQRN